MRPSISPGDVVLASSPPPVDQLGGRVVVFSSPDVPGRIVTHRVVEVAPDGQMRTKGDANQSADSSTITSQNVIGLGRLLVRGIGLPVKWAQDGQFVPLGLFLLSVLLAALAVRYDREDEDLEDAVHAVDAGSGEPPPPPFPFTPHRWSRCLDGGRRLPARARSSGRASRRRPSSSCSSCCTRWR